MSNIVYNTNANIKVTAKSGDLEVIGDGTVVVSTERPLSLSVDDFEVKFNFENDLTDKARRYSADVVQSVLSIKMINFKNPLGEGIMDPWKIGVAYNRACYLSFWVWTPDENAESRIMNYAIYLGEPSNG